MRGPGILASAALGIALWLAPLSVPATEPPPGLASLQAFAPEPGPDVAFAAEKRASAVRLAALGFGARAGLARRAWEIAAMLDRHGAKLSAIYRFGDLVLRRDGFTVLPPVLAETRRAFRLEPTGNRAASARRVLRILEPARLVSAAPDWRDWLERSWLPAEPPASVLFPRDNRGTRDGGACWPRAGRRVWRWPTTSSPPTSTGSTAPSRAWCSGTGSTAPGC